jgi:hypothetical protein
MDSKPSFFFFTRGQELHKCWTYVTAGALPFTSLLSILPLPNVVLFYNLFRAHANWHAWKVSKSRPYPYYHTHIK